MGKRLCGHSDEALISSICVKGKKQGKKKFFFFNDTATNEIYTLSLHDALPSAVNVAVRHLSCQRRAMPQIAAFECEVYPC